MGYPDGIDHERRYPAFTFTLEGRRGKQQFIEFINEKLSRRTEYKTDIVWISIQGGASCI